MTDTAYDPVPPAVARAYTLFELAAILGWLRESGFGDASFLSAQLQEAELPAHLTARIEAALAGPIAPSDLQPNPFFSPQQAVAVFAQLELAAESDEVPTEAVRELGDLWNRHHGLDAEPTAWLRKRLATLHPPTSSQRNPVDVFWNPPPFVEGFASRALDQLALGAHKFVSFASVPKVVWEHPRDRAALRRMKEVTGFDTMLRLFSNWHVERVQRILSRSERIQVTPRQFPGLYRLWVECIERAALDEREPLLYVEQGPLNAFTTGVEERQVVVSSSLVSLLEQREMMFVLGHELGHIKSDHVLYSMFAQTLPTLLNAIGSATLGIGKLLGQGLQFAILDWYRCAELSCDRHGLLVCQDLNAAQRVLMKLSGAPPTLYGQLDTEAFAGQGARFREEDAPANKVYQYFLLAYQTHPWPAVRAHEIGAWVAEGHYDRILGSAPSGTLPPGADGSGGACSTCGAGVEEGDRFCVGCGMAVGAR